MCPQHSQVPFRGSSQRESPATEGLGFNKKVKGLMTLNGPMQKFRSKIKEIRGDFNLNDMEHAIISLRTELENSDCRT